MAASPVPAAGGAMLYYLLAYAFTNLGAFAVVVALERSGEPHGQISDYRGLARSHPGLAAAMTLFMLSLTGVPPLGGFLGKFYIFSASLNAGLVWLVIIAGLNSVISAYYYIRVIVAMYMQDGGVAVEPLSHRPGVLISVAVSAIATVAIGLFPQPYMTAAASAYAAAVGRPALHTAALVR
jgi:NADH-quinone oxidoreductase subunit N